MANISEYLAQILAAVYGEQVRGSIYHAIDEINKASEVSIGAGTAIHDNDPKGTGYYENSLYINTDTDQLLKCGATNWHVVSSIRGNGISEITGPVKDGLKDTYTIHYTDGNDITIDVYNGRGITKFELTDKTGLVDTYTITYNDATTSEMKVKNGNQWYSGTAITGGSSTPTGFTLPFEVKAGDFYLNISTDDVYKCVSGADANVTSTWSWELTITSSSTGTNNYGMLQNKPAINGHTLLGNMTNADLDLDAWLTDTATPPVIIEKPMAVGSSEVRFNSTELATVYTNGWGVKPWFSVADGQTAPSLKKIYKDSTTGEMVIKYSKVKEAQAGGPSGTACKCKLRIIK